MTEPPPRAYLAAIGRRGGIKSRRHLSSEQARQMVARREARRAARAFAASRLAAPAPTPRLPGADLVHQGLVDLADGRATVEAMLVAIAAPRLHQLGVRVVHGFDDPEHALWEHLSRERGAGAHSAYNALRRELTSFARAAAVRLRA
jgi:hypothetical protein